MPACNSVVIPKPGVIIGVDPLGLRNLELTNSRGTQYVRCPLCEKVNSFIPEDLYWDVSDSFEGTRIGCGDCKKVFELLAMALVTTYSFTGHTILTPEEIYEN